MPKRTHISLWVCLGVLALSIIVSTVLLYGEISELRTQLETAVGARPAAARSTGLGAAVPAVPTVPPNVGGVDMWGTTLTVRAIGAANPISATAVITLAVRGSGAADPLFDLPVLVCDGQAYSVDGDSLAGARQDLLMLITHGEAHTALQFHGAPDLAQLCVVVLNPEQATTSIVAPRIEVPVPALPSVPPTPEGSGE